MLTPRLSLRRSEDSSTATGSHAQRTVTSAARGRSGRLLGIACLTPIVEWEGTVKLLRLDRA